MPTERHIQRRTVLGGAVAAGAVAAAGPLPGATGRPAAAADRQEGAEEPGRGDRKVALITGTSSGFGHLTALTLAREGLAVFASMRDTRGANAAAARKLRTLAAEEDLALQVVDIDVRDDDSVARGVERVLGRAGRVDVLVNNAGVFYPAILETLSVDDVRAVFETNVFGHLRMNRAVLPAMRARGEGLVVQTTTALGRFVFPFMGAYVGTKWAMEAMAEASRYELRRLGVDVVIVEPGAYDTDFVAPNAVRYYDRYLRGLDRDAARRRAAYGDLARRTEDHLVEEPGLPDPQEVADAIAGLVRTPSAERPVRLPVAGAAEFLGEVHTVHAEFQRAVLEGSGYGDLL
ncbi:SDR family NAD(P)-dependent oxidoreductase [Streptomyces sp. WMMC500]|uniref:SDR family NAD(P)-dependent oxidoreductase n=1 Tax=Streptomyces sp. WMMC500 TaxID=3015154 RepID=UPI00248C3AE5|nr:SDR family NAD(P)-dependent oxidoreductase [Streptomyces sp. WMMC500]WBB61682.1 SDR family NAD(P)-dependent oxidoreductase [Streptomyces sp. WMMC500]